MRTGQLLLVLILSSIAGAHLVAAQENVTPYFLLTKQELIPELAREQSLVTISFAMPGVSFDDLAGEKGRYVQRWERQEPGSRAAYLGTGSTNSSKQSPVRVRLASLPQDRRGFWQTSTSFIWVEELNNGVRVKVMCERIAPSDLRDVLRVMIMPVKQEAYIARAH